MAKADHLHHDLVEGKVDWKGRTAVKKTHGGMKTSLLILGAFGFENLATVSLAVNLVTYFNGVMHFEIADAANEVTNYLGTSYILSILVAVLADTYIGIFKAVLISGTVELLGLALLAIQAHYPKAWHCRNQSCSASHGADQFDDKDPQEARHMSNFFNYLLLALCFGGSISLTFGVWIQDNKGWDWGFGFGAIAMFLGLITFASGLLKYRLHPVKKKQVS
ncbi:hypothetical protein Dsin_020738 [Dipteronia sinensis]|uniref:Uncharacterized protein n=1 Tax=Dipteronia sinensis TaxID=43782 RepID=A0AAE0AA91_9ROSI|nr:hypothetical protein Dsin_020738 [Dipteronia sinensis]